MAGIHIFAPKVLQRVDTGRRRTTYCWECRKQTERALIRTQVDNPYLGPDFAWHCTTCRKDTNFGESPLSIKPIDWQPEGTTFEMPEHWFPNKDQK